LIRKGFDPLNTGYTYIMSDIHGNSERFNSVMKQIQLQLEDKLYVLGDVIDRYPDGIRILRKLMAMPNVQMLLGNHEYMMLDALYYNADCPPDWWGQSKYIRLWYSNGGSITHSYMKHIRKSLRLELFTFLHSLPLNIEIAVNDKKYILVHGGVDDEAECMSTSEIVWKRIRGYEPMPEGKTVIFGHTPTAHYQEAVPMKIWHGKGMIGIDCGCGYPEDGRLACLRLDDMKEFYSDS
jgi:serine/threonine protein phosphatase 1